MNIEVRAPQRAQKTKLEIVDCDFHPKITLEQMRPYPEQSLVGLLQTYGNRSRHGYAKGYPYPKMTPQASRRDAWPPGGGLPASDLDFMRQQHLDFYGIDVRDHESAVADRAGRPERRTLGRAWRLRRERIPARRMDRRRAAAEGLGRGALRGWRGVRAPRSAPRGRPRFAQVFLLSRMSEAARATSDTGRSTRPRSRPGCRSVSTCSVTAAGR